MEHKTISNLNSKAWYRLLKVLFGICLLIVLGGYNLIIFSVGVKQVDQNQTTILCNIFKSDPSTKTPFSPASMGISFNASDFPNGQFDYKGYFRGYNDFNILAILKKCAGQDVNHQKTLTYYGDVYNDQKSTEIFNSYGLVGATSLTQAQTDTYNAEYNAYKQETSGLFGVEKAQYLNFSFHMFDITPIFTYNGFLELFFIGNFVILLIFEAARRAFYYIVLGSIRPVK
jgi:hypothetical protein